MRGGPARTAANLCRHTPPWPADALAVEAMRLYVRTLEEEVADWWAQHSSAAAAAAADQPAAANGVSEGSTAEQAAGGEGSAAPPPAIKSRSVAEVVVEGSWVSPYISSDKRPPPRYEHAAAIIGAELFVVGGNYGALPRWRYRPLTFLSSCCLLRALACCLDGLPRALHLHHPACRRRPLPERHLGPQPGEPHLARADAAEPRRQQRAASVQRPRGGRGAAAAARGVCAHCGARGGALAGQCGAGGRPREGASFLFKGLGIHWVCERRPVQCGWQPSAGLHALPRYAPPHPAPPTRYLPACRSRARARRACLQSCQCGCWTPLRAHGPQCSAARLRERSCPSRAAAIRCALDGCRAGAVALPWRLLPCCCLPAARRCLHGRCTASLPRHVCARRLALQGVLVGSRLFLFGGEDVMRRPLGELLVLDLQTWHWSRPESSGERGVRLRRCRGGAGSLGRGCPPCGGDVGAGLAAAVLAG